MKALAIAIILGWSCSAAQAQEAAEAGAPGRAEPLTVLTKAGRIAFELSSLSPSDLEETISEIVLFYSSRFGAREESPLRIVETGDSGGGPGIEEAPNTVYLKTAELASADLETTLADKLAKQFRDHMGTDKDAQVPAASVNQDLDLNLQGGGDRIFHPRRQR